MGQNQNQLRDSEVGILGRGGRRSSKEGNLMEREEEDDMWWCWYYVSMDFGNNIDGDIVSVFLKGDDDHMSNVFDNNKKLTMVRLMAEV